MRRRCLDMLRQDNSAEAERLLGHMDDIFAILVTMDYPDAITNGLRRQTDVIRAIIERTRGDVTFSLRGEKLERSLSRLSGQLPGSEPLLERARRCPCRLKKRCSPMPASGQRHRLILYTYILNRCWRAILGIGIVLVALVAALAWLPSILPQYTPPQVAGWILRFTA